MFGQWLNKHNWYLGQTLSLSRVEVSFKTGAGDVRFLRVVEGIWGKRRAKGAEVLPMLGPSKQPLADPLLSPLHALPAPTVTPAVALKVTATARLCFGVPGMGMLPGCGI